MFSNKKLLNKLYTIQQEAVPHIVFSHSDKTWIMPVDSLSTAFDMYQPSTLKGKLLKKLVIAFRDNNKILCKLKCKKVHLKINESIKLYIEKVIGKKDFSIAAYMGDSTSKQNNKATLQIYNDEGLICYAKVTEDEEVAETFEREIRVLKFLEDKKIKGVPKVLSVDTVDGMKVFLQSTDKNINEKVKLTLGRQQLEFTDNIVRQTKIKSKYSETDFFEMVQYLKKNLSYYTKRQQNVIEESIRIVEEKLEKNDVEYASSHGDYTPWNVYYTNDELYAFDFEYSSDTMPCYMDVFHYLTQMSLLGFKNDVGKTIHMYKSKRKLLEEYIPNTNFVYLCYLIWIVGFYNKRAEDKMDIANGQSEKWIAIMEYLAGKLK